MGSLAPHKLVTINRLIWLGGVWTTAFSTRKRSGNSLSYVPHISYRIRGLLNWPTWPTFRLKKSARESGAVGCKKLGDAFGLTLYKTFRRHGLQLLTELVQSGAADAC